MAGKGMRTVQADFYIKINESYNIEEVIGRTVIYTLDSQSSAGSQMKWYEDTYKPEYRREE